MDNNWAADHLQTIRTLMERSALYRRTLAPIMIVTGTLGVAGFALSRGIPIESSRTFGLFWLSVGIGSMVPAFLLARRQALKDAEHFWSLPTQRVANALLPAFLVGFAVGVSLLVWDTTGLPWILAIAWVTAYGCALHAAGFFLQRGIRLFSWGFILGGIALLLSAPGCPSLRTSEAAHAIMGCFFGLFHLAYGIYLYFTEKKKTIS